MFPLLAIPIVSQATGTVVNSVSFLDQPVDAILFDLFIWFGWIPVVITLGLGFTQMWLNYRRGIFSSKLKFIVLAIDVPNMTEQTPKALENLFSSLYGTKSTITWKETWMDGKLHPVFSFEIVSTEGYIQFLVRTQTRFRDVVEAGIYAHYPEAEIAEVEDYAAKFPNEYPNDEYEMWGGEMTFDKPSMYPIRTYLDFEDRMSQEIKDPLSVTLEQFAKMRPGEHLWVQFLIQPSTNDWQKVGVKYVRKIYGDEDKAKKSAFLSSLESAVSWPAGVVAHATGVDLADLFFAQDPKKEDDPFKAFKITLPQKEEAEAILRKASKVGYGVKIRIVYVARKNAFVKVERTGIVKGFLNQYAHLNFNKFTLFIPQVPKDDYFWMRWEYTTKQRRLMTAYQKRSWGIGSDPIWMNVEELATLWHFPTITTKAPLVKKSESKRGEPPVGLPMTFLEDTLPGMPPPSAEQFAASASAQEGFSPEFVFTPGSEEPLAEALPQLQPPTTSTNPSFTPSPEPPQPSWSPEPAASPTEDSDLPPMDFTPKEEEGPVDPSVPPNLPI